MIEAFDFVAEELEVEAELMQNRLIHFSTFYIEVGHIK